MCKKEAKRQRSKEARNSRSEFSEQVHGGEKPDGTRLRGEACPRGRRVLGEGY